MPDENASTQNGPGIDVCGQGLKKHRHSLEKRNPPEFAIKDHPINVGMLRNRTVHPRAKSRTASGSISFFRRGSVFCRCGVILRELAKEEEYSLSSLGMAPAESEPFRILELPLRTRYHGELFNVDRHHFFENGVLVGRKWSPLDGDAMSSYS